MLIKVNLESICMIWGILLVAEKKKILYMVEAMGGGVFTYIVDAPCILYDLDGYYTGLRMLLGHMIETGLSSEERQKGIYFAKDLVEIKAIMNR